MRVVPALLLVLVVVACGSNTATTPLSAQSPGTGASAQAVEPPTGVGSPSAGPPSPLGHAAPGLEARLPSQVDGALLSKVSGTGNDVFQDDPWSREITKFLADVGLAPADFRFAQAWSADSSLDLELGLFEVSGVDAASLRDAILDGSRAGSPGLETGSARLSGMQLTTVLYTDNPSTLYLYEHDGAVFYVATADEALAGRVLAAIP